jgi:hypothetical protein
MADDGPLHCMGCCVMAAVSREYEFVLDSLWCPGSCCRLVSQGRFVRPFLLVQAL